MKELPYLAIKLKQARRNAGISASDAGKLVNRGDSTIYAWENGVAEPSAEQLIALCRAYGVDIPYFYPPELNRKLSSAEQTLIERYRNMTEDNQAIFYGLSEILSK